MRSALLANLGFVLQTSGIFIIAPIIISFILNETNATIGLFLTASAFLVLGFLLNSLCERKAMSYKQSCGLIVLVFIGLSFIGSLPYLYINLSNGGPIQSFTDCVFESTSGYTTTGFSIISDFSNLPKSIILYRALSQFIGGIGIVLIILAFFYPDAKLKEFSRSMGYGENSKIKKTLILILSIYCTFTVIMVISGFLLGYTDLINLTSFIFSALSTGGLAPIVDITSAVTQTPLNFIVPISMLFGATNFVILTGLFKKKFKEFFKSEVSAFIILAISAVFIVQYFFKLTPYDTTFHILSTMTTTGFSYLPIQTAPDTFKITLIVLMFIGGTSLSTAGGVKISRILLLLKSAKRAITQKITRKRNKITLNGKEIPKYEIIRSIMMIVLMIVTILVSALILTLYGFSPIDAAFEVTAAISTTGLSVGIAGPTLILPLKWLFIGLMIIGRVEIITILAIFLRSKQQKQRPNKREANQ